MRHVRSGPPRRSSLWGDLALARFLVDIRLIFRSLLGRSGTFHMQKLSPALQINITSLSGYIKYR